MIGVLLFQKSFCFNQEWAGRIVQRIAIYPMTGKRGKIESTIQNL